MPARICYTCNERIVYDRENNGIIEIESVGKENGAGKKNKIRKRNKIR